MKHLGDITKISGYNVPIVDCIIGGSPCQDLSVAGKRAGLDGERSGLYMEQIRIVKEMRKQDERNGRTGVDIRPRYMVWENVPGAFSSNKGEDFRIVLEEIAKVCDKDAVIPMPDKGKWTNSGCILGDGWSVAWRVLDAQFWGVPQRRRRIALVADFGGQSAQEILFVSKGVSGHTDESKPKRKGTSTDAQGSLGEDDCERVFCFEPGAAKRLGGYVWEGLAPTLRTEVGDNRPSVAYGISSYNSNAMKSSNPHSGIYEADTSRTLDLNGGKSSCIVTEGQAPTLTCTHGGEPAVCYWDGGQVAGTLTANNAGGSQRMPDKENFNCVVAVDCRNGTEIVRRLTPLECERLQGYPDGWTDIGEWTDSNGKKRQTSDAARYKALGNSISLPNWKWLLKRLCACYERDATMASLFDGIGGFPYLWEQLNGKGTCLWASEIEEFPMAVTKVRIGE